MQKTKYPGVYRLPDGRYRTISRYTDPRTGQSRRLVRTWSVATAAEAQQRRLESRQDALDGMSPQRMRLSEYAASWIERKAAELAPSTVDRYARTLALHVLPKLGEVYLDALQGADIVRWRDDLASTQKPESVNSHLRVLRGVLADAASELQQHDPSARVKQVASVPTQARKSLTADELRALLETMRDFDHGVYACLLTLALTGMRWSEVSALRWSDVGDAEIRVHRSQWRGHQRDTTKTKASRTVPNTPDLSAVLNQHRALELRRRTSSCELVFATSEGKPRSRTWASKALERAVQEAGVHRITLHGFRHTLNNLLRGVSTAEVQKSITGHVSEAMRQHYSHVAVPEKAAAVGRVVALLRSNKASP